MTTQIAVRIPDEYVVLIDRWVDEGRGRSRAHVVTRALERERRREAAERDAVIYAGSGEDPEFAGLAEYAASVPLPELD